MTARDGENGGNAIAAGEGVRELSETSVGESAGESEESEEESAGEVHVVGLLCSRVVNGEKKSK